MTLYINDVLENEIKSEGEKAYPNECCGILFGILSEEKKTVTQILPIGNEYSENEQYHRFLIAPEQMMQAEKQARAKRLDVLGFYHSHPDHPARPSDFDREHALPFYSYVITAVEKSKAKETTSWILKDDRTQFLAEEIFVEHK
jgi:proteasome lid subunit RPN8/RPN11